jgi:branched-chain amino acid transport system ATP-binding protein
MLVVEGIHTYYGESHILQGVSLHVEAGELVALLGRNGAGKTTTMNSIIGFNRPRAGKIVLRGRNMTGQPPYAIAAAGVGLVPQGRRIFAPLSVRENLVFAESHRGPWTLQKVYELFPRLEERQHNRGNSLSGGEQQMLAIGRALMMQPQILILDEPTLGLAPVILELLSKALEKLRQTTSITVLLGEQNVTFALPHADRVYVLEHARIVWEGDPGRFAAEAGADFL